MFESSNVLNKQNIYYPLDDGQGMAFYVDANPSLRFKVFTLTRSSTTAEEIGNISSNTLSVKYGLYTIINCKKFSTLRVTDITNTPNSTTNKFEVYKMNTDGSLTFVSNFGAFPTSTSINVKTIDFLFIAYNRHNSTGNKLGFKIYILN